MLGNWSGLADGDKADLGPVFQAARFAAGLGGMKIDMVAFLTMLTGTA